ncbi:hypothetical protein HS048_06335 [Planomonospora sp. ID91781]|uniref:hypothetical protein n=1 Tax=Planomonospora sp. ID91781 TaxID=2738135 RepID=UPI0018C41036|nr:hypothetical protein [Planomonospora sp. ID91781]MBG0820353.1 hypothetical protein [Planomonospora sp. ID91781]
MAVVIALVSGLCGCSQPDPLPVPEPAGQVWPGAFFEVPQEIKGFGDVTPVAMLGAREVLLRSRTAMLAYDRRNRRHRIPAEPPADGLFGEVLSAVVGDREVVLMEGDAEISALWSIPRAGGSARLLAASIPEPGMVAGMVADGGKVVWWKYNGTSREVPLSGGEPRGSHHQELDYISRWPWGHRGEDGVVNLVTGEKRDTQAVGYGHDVRCGPEWCVSASKDSRYESQEVVVQRLDGSDRRRVPGKIMYGGLFVGERYGVFDAPEAARDQSMIDPGGIWGDAVVVYDRCTGKTGLLDAPEPPEPSEPEVQDARSRRYPNVIRNGEDSSGILMYWKVPGDRYTVFALPDPSAGKEAACT